MKGTTFMRSITLLSSVLVPVTFSYFKARAECHFSFFSFISASSQHQFTPLCYAWIANDEQEVRE
jgi:hypothetical protein